MTRVALLGLGAMGSRMAASLLRGGFAPAVWNRDPAKAAPLVAGGATLAPTAAAAARGADLVFCMVRDDAASREVWLGREGALDAMAPGAVAIECSTVTPGHARALAGAAGARGVAFLDAPVSGSRPQAEAAQLVWMVGGEAGALERARPALLAMGAAVFHAGPAGAGATVKLAVNGLLAAQVAYLAEMLGLLRAGGIDLKVAAEIVCATPVCGPAAKANLGAMLAGGVGPLFPVELMLKDLGYALASGADLPMTAAAHAVFGRAEAAGDGDANMTAVARLYGPAPEGSAPA